MPKLLFYTLEDEIFNRSNKPLPNYVSIISKGRPLSFFVNFYFLAD